MDTLETEDERTRLLLKPDEVAHLLGIGRSKAYAMINANEIPSIRMGGSLRVPLAGLKAWVAEKTAASQE